MHFANSLYLTAKADKAAVNPSRQIFIFANNSRRFLQGGDASEEWPSPYLRIAISLSGDTLNIPSSDEPRKLNCMAF